MYIPVFVMIFAFLNVNGSIEGIFDGLFLQGIQSAPLGSLNAQKSIGRYKMLHNICFYL